MNTSLYSWARQGSNLRPKDYESPALTTELRALAATTTSSSLEGDDPAAWEMETSVPDECILVPRCTHRTFFDVSLDSRTCVR